MKRLIEILLATVCLNLAGAHADTDNQALLRQKVIIDPPVYRLTATVSNDLYDHDLFRLPVRACASYVVDPVNWIFHSSLLLGVDHTWSRIIYRDDIDGWFHSYGSHGSGDGPEFRSPTSIDAFTQQSPSSYWSYYKVYVADWWNNRIKRLEYNWYTHTFTDVGPITDFGISRPIDLDYNNAGTFDEDDFAYLVILNGDYRIIGYDLKYDELYFEYGSAGSGIGHFYNPTAIACGRSWIEIGNPYFQSYANTEEVYVADAGNERLVKLYGSWHYVSWDTVWSNPLAAYIVDLEVDNFGHVWAALTTGQILKFTPDLELLTIFGSEGFGENQFYQPECIANVGGFLGVGDMIITEDWSDSSGIQHYFTGTDIEDLSVALVDNGDGCEACISFKLVDYGFLSVRIYDEYDAEVKNLSYGDRVESGWHYVWWNGTDAQGAPVPLGDYRAEVIDTSAYIWLSTGEPANIVMEDEWFYFCAGCSVGLLIGDADGSGAYDIDDVTYLSNYVFSGGPPPTPAASASGDANCSCVEPAVDIDDVVYLIAYIFSGGPAPCTCEEWVDLCGELH